MKLEAYAAAIIKLDSAWNLASRMYSPDPGVFATKQDLESRILSALVEALCKEGQLVTAVHFGHVARRYTSGKARQAVDKWLVWMYGRCKF